MPKPQQYTTILDHQLRIRTTLEFEGVSISHWAVQLEFQVSASNWEWVVRYDTAGGNIHRDRHLIAQHETVAFPNDPALAIKTAQDDVSQHGMLYAQAYLEAKKLE
jgi:hypothetical protein